MGSLWVTNDVETQERRNREAIATRYALPLYDVDDALAVQVVPVAAAANLTATLATIWTVPAGVGVVQTITIANIDGAAAHSVNLYLCEAGATAANVPRQIFADRVEATESIVIQIPYHLNATGAITGSTDAGGVVSVFVTALTFSAWPAGQRIVIQEGVALAASPMTLYTCPGDARQAIVLAATFCNTSGATSVLTLLLASVAVCRVALLPHESFWYEGNTSITPGATVVADATSAGVSCRLTVLEVL